MINSLEHENWQYDRALGTLTAGALGDALGMPTQAMSKKEILQTYGTITGFMAPYKGHPIAEGLAVASVTDDTEQSLLLASQLIESPTTFDEKQWAKALLNWEATMKAKNLHDLLGPSTKQALERISAGEPVALAGRNGDTNGAAMRIAPVGIATPLEPLERLVENVIATSRVTHNTPLAISAASAVAAAISAGIEGADYVEATKIAITSARLAHQRSLGNPTHAAIAKQIQQAIQIANQATSTTIETIETVMAKIILEIGTSVASAESVPAAFALLHVSQGDAWKAGLLSAQIGGDTDTMGSISAGIAGACSGFKALPQKEVATLHSVNSLDLENIAEGLFSLRKQRQAKARQEGLA